MLLFAKGQGSLQAKVADFGLATGLEGTSLAISEQVGVVGLTGTYAYMSPEAWRNERLVISGYMICSHADRCGSVGGPLER